MNAASVQKLLLAVALMEALQKKTLTLDVADVQALLPGVDLSEVTVDGKVTIDVDKAKELRDKLVLPDLSNSEREITLTMTDVFNHQTNSACYH